MSKPALINILDKNDKSEHTTHLDNVVRIIIFWQHMIIVIRFHRVSFGFILIYKGFIFFLWLHYTEKLGLCSACFELYKQIYVYLIHSG